MAIGFDRVLGGHDQALLIRERRATLLANNLANSDTPGFKARDLDFRSLVKEAMGSASETGMRRTEAAHIGAGEFGGASGEALYRTPLQPSIDGNTVDEHVEMAAFARNTLDFQASLTFLQSKFRGLKTALKGE
ncbi:MAG: flagellar basal body rod protein FlgB [Gammaproteobacteria bacterium]